MTALGERRPLGDHADLTAAIVTVHHGHRQC